MKGASRARSIVVVVAIFALASIGLVGATAPYPTTPATATVDGNPSEWDLTNDFFADMYRAGDPTKVVQSKLYLRYDPSTSTLFVLVLTETAYPGLRLDDEAWVKIDGSKMVDGSFPDFEWVEFSPPEANVKGYEASFTLAPGEYTVDVHIQVLGQEPPEYSETSRTLKTGLDLFVVPQGPILALIGSMLAAFGLFAYKRRKQ